MKERKKTIDASLQIATDQLIEIRRWMGEIPDLLETLDEWELDLAEASTTLLDCFTKIQSVNHLLLEWPDEPALARYRKPFAAHIKKAEEVFLEVVGDKVAKFAKQPGDFSIDEIDILSKGLALLTKGVMQNNSRLLPTCFQFINVLCVLTEAQIGNWDNRLRLVIRSMVQLVNNITAEGESALSWQSQMLGQANKVRSLLAPDYDYLLSTEAVEAHFKEFQAGDQFLKAHQGSVAQLTWTIKLLTAVFETEDSIFDDEHYDHLLAQLTSSAEAYENGGHLNYNQVADQYNRFVESYNCFLQFHYLLLFQLFEDPTDLAAAENLCTVAHTDQGSRYHSKACQEDDTILNPRTEAGAFEVVDDKPNFEPQVNSRHVDKERIKPQSSSARHNKSTGMTDAQKLDRLKESMIKGCQSYIDNIQSHYTWHAPTYFWGWVPLANVSLFPRHADTGKAQEFIVRIQEQVAPDMLVNMFIEQLRALDGNLYHDSFKPVVLRTLVESIIGPTLATLNNFLEEEQVVSLVRALHEPDLSSLRIDELNSLYDNMNHYLCLFVQSDAISPTLFAKTRQVEKITLSSTQKARIEGFEPKDMII